MKPPRIALIHATPLAMQPVAAAFAQLWPQASLMNLLDDSLSQDLAAAGSLNDAMVQRFVDLAHYVKAQGADAILFTCSAFGPAIEVAGKSVGIPTLKPNEAMFEEALDICARLGGARRVGLLTTFGPSAAPMQKEFDAAVRQRGQVTALDCACATGGMEALNCGDAATHDRLILEQLPHVTACDVLMLGQFSMARAQAAVEQASGKTVLTSPASAVRSLQKLLTARV
jgi:Asp/Glu/hydantoin racemase